jgi:DNA gyrase subunit A
MKGYKIPNFGRTSKGLPIVNLLDLAEGEELATCMTLKDFNEGYLFFTTSNGITKRTKVEDFQNIRANGIRAISLKDEDTLHSVKFTDGQRDIIIGASNGKAIRFHEDQVRSMGRTAAGVKGIDLTEGEKVVGVTVVTDEQSQVLAITRLGYGKRTEVDEYRAQNRGGKGVKTINITEKNGDLAKLISVVGDEDLFVVSNQGMIIRTPIEQISISKRATQGVKIINLVEEQFVKTIALINKEDEDDEIVDPIDTDTQEGQEYVEETKNNELSEEISQD